MSIFNDIREFFWPILEDDEEINKFPKKLSVEEITVDNKNLNIVFDQALRIYESEEDRKKTVEFKSSLFIGSISIITSIIVAATSLLIEIDKFSYTSFTFVLLLFILTIYMIRTVWFSLQALERKNYHNISINDFLIPDQEENSYYKRAIANIINKVRKNYSAINSKVDSMVMAQEYFKRAIVIVAIYAFFILLFYVLKII